MLRVYHSNDLEVLVGLMAELHFKAHSSNDLLAPEVVLVQSYGMGRWIKVKLAELQSISANIHCVLPASFIWNLVKIAFPNIPPLSPYDREVLAWRIARILPRLAQDPTYSAIRQYISANFSAEQYGDKLHQLSTKIASVFDSYLVYRPDWIKAWESGQLLNLDSELAWEASLWNELITDCNAHCQVSFLHRVDLYREVKKILLISPDNFALLPQRISLFGISSLPPQNITLLNELSEIIDIHVFLLNPCAHYWGDILNRKALQKMQRRISDSDVSWDNLHYTQGNPLLASMGQTGKEFIDLILDCHVAEEITAFYAQETDNVLQLIKRDILELYDSSEVPRPDAERLRSSVINGQDKSIALHISHSRLREVQILHDQLLAMFEEIPNLAPRQILVMASDIEKYAPHIAAVFGAEDEQIPWAVSDISSMTMSPLVSVIERVLDLPHSRATASEIMALIREEGIRNKFTIEDVDLPIIEVWIEEANIRWGFENSLQEDIFANNAAQNTWQFGLRRLLAGYSSNNDFPTLGILPIPINDSNQAILLGKLAQIIHILQGFRHAVSQPKKMNEWRDLVLSIIDKLFQVDDKCLAVFSSLTTALSDLLRESEVALYDIPFSAKVFKEKLSSKYQSASPHQRFLSGEVTFCSLLPMRSIPFRVICLLGMNDGEFPGFQDKQQFDLIAKNPRQKGDRAKRDDDRYLFLETLISARERFYISYIGRDPRDNTPLNPSSVVSELWEYLEHSLGGTLEERLQIRDRLITEHPLQPFSPRYFSKDEQDRLFSYSKQWVPQEVSPDPLPAGRENLAPYFDKKYITNLADSNRDLSLNETIPLTDLLDFYKHPCRYFLVRTLGVSFETEEELEDLEPFMPKGLERWRLRSDLIKQQLSDHPLPSVEEYALSSGQLPISPFDKISFARECSETSNLVHALKTTAFSEAKSLSVYLALDKSALSGRIAGITSAGLVNYYPGSATYKQVLPLWLSHLVISAMDKQVGHTRLFTVDKVYALSPVDRTSAISLLNQLLDIFLRGRVRPLPFFPAMAEVILKHLDQGLSSQVETLKHFFRGSSEQRSEGSDPYVRRVFEEDLLFHQNSEQLYELELLSRQILPPLAKHLQLSKYTGDKRCKC